MLNLFILSIIPSFTFMPANIKIDQGIKENQISQNYTNRGFKEL